jgi:hypothetical protein
MVQNYDWMFPGYKFYKNGDIESRVETYYNHVRGFYARNPNFGKLLKWRQHPEFEFLFTNVRDRYGSPVSVYKHVVVAILNHGVPPRDNMMPHHKDGNRLNNTSRNLMWITQGELNLIQAREGRRDMIAGAAMMRAKGKRK